MSLSICLCLGALAAWMVGALAWAFLGPFVASLVTMFSFFAGSLLTILWINQGRTP